MQPTMTSSIDIPTMFDHDRFPAMTLPTNSSMDTYRQFGHEAKFARLFRHVLPYLNHSQLRQVQLVNRTMDTVVRRHVWRQPSFHNHPTSSPLVVFRRFLSHLPHFRPVTQQTIHTLCLCPMDESLYDRVPKDFLITLTRWIPHLRTLNLSRATFFSASSLPPAHWQWQHLTSLDVSYVEHMSDPLLVQLAVSLPQLCLIRLDGTPVNHGVGQLAHHCDQLRSLSLTRATHLTDEALVALAKFRTIHVTELDISECRKVTSVGLDVVAKYCVHLSWLGLANTPLTLATLRQWDHRFWKYLDIASCQQLHDDLKAHPQQQQLQQPWNEKYQGDILATATTPPPTKASLSLYDLIIKAPKLQHLSLSMPVIHHLLSALPALIDVDGDSPSQVDRLSIHDLPEHTPLTTLDDLRRLFPKLQHLTLVRGYYQSDYKHLSFSPEEEEHITNTTATITEESIKSYRHGLASLVLEQRRDLLEGPSLW